MWRDSGRSGAITTTHRYKASLSWVLSPYRLESFALHFRSTYSKLIVAHEADGVCLSASGGQAAAHIGYFASAWSCDPSIFLRVTRRYLIVVNERHGDLSCKASMQATSKNRESHGN